MLSVCDVLLDTLHWSGGNTSLDALAAGLPIVTIEGELMRGRQSASMLRYLGLDECIAFDARAAVTKAVAVADDSHALRMQILREHDALFDREEPIRALERELLRLVEEHS